MPELTMRFDVFCSVCGKGLCESVVENDSVRGPSIKLPPCEDCLEREKDDAFDEGREKGREEG